MNDQNYGKKGSCFIKFLIAVILFVLLLIWVYRMNFDLTF